MTSPPPVTFGADGLIPAVVQDVGSNAVVTNDVPARGVVIGVPGRVVRWVGDEDLLERWE